MARLSGARQLLAVALAEPGVLRAVLEAVRRWLGDNRDAVLAGGPGTPPDLAAWQPQRLWDALVNDYVVPAVQQVWMSRWMDSEREQALRDPDARIAAYLRTVRSRLRAFATESFEIIRTELLDGIARGESVPQLRDRVGRALDIDGPSRAILNQIMAVEAVIDDPASTPAQVAAARQRRRELYQLQDAADRQWQWRAERIARTETVGAFNGGEYAAADAQSTLFGDRLGLEWWATRDTRTRTTHRKAHGQVVPVGTRFDVGQAQLLYPGDPSVDAPQEVINCRCVAITIDLALAPVALRGHDAHQR